MNEESKNVRLGSAQVTRHLSLTLLGAGGGVSGAGGGLGSPSGHYAISRLEASSDSSLGCRMGWVTARVG